MLPPVKNNAFRMQEAGDFVGASRAGRDHHLVSLQACLPWSTVKPPTLIVSVRLGGQVYPSRLSQSLPTTSEIGDIRHMCVIQYGSAW